MKVNNISDELVQFLENFTIAILRNKPNDLWKFGGEYFCHSNKEAVKIIQDNLNVESLHQVDLATNMDVPQWQKPIVMQDSEAESETQEFYPETSIENQRRQGVTAEPFNPDVEKENKQSEPSIYPKSPEIIEQLKIACKDIVLFNELDDADLDSVILSMFEKKVSADENVIVERTDGDNFYIIQSGRFAAKITDEGEQKVVKEYDNSGYFGELALMYNAPRSATVTALTNGVLWALSRDAFRTLVLGHAAKRRREFISVLESVEILASLTSEQQMVLADALEIRNYEEGDTIINEGEPGTEIFFIMSGSVIIKKGVNGEDIFLTKIEKGGYFGELALLIHEPRAASAIAETDTCLAVLGVESFERLLGPCIDLMRENATAYEHRASS